MPLIILAHPSYETSIANKTIINFLQQTELNFEVRNIAKLYPHQKINIEEEQQALLRHDLVILQHPMYWFSAPAILKSWFDQVLTYQFAYGSKGNKLQSKTLLQSITVGQVEKNFLDHSGNNIMNELLLPFKKSAEYINMNYKIAPILYDIATITGHTTEEIRSLATIHASKVYQSITNN